MLNSIRIRRPALLYSIRDFDFALLLGAGVQRVAWADASGQTTSSVSDSPAAALAPTASSRGTSISCTNCASLPDCNATLNRRRLALPPAGVAAGVGSGAISTTSATSFSGSSSSFCCCCCCSTSSLRSVRFGDEAAGPIEVEPAAVVEVVRELLQLAGRVVLVEQSAAGNWHWWAVA